MDNRASQVLTFNGSLDMDSSRQNIKVGDYYNALNVRNTYTDNGQEGSLENINGNALVSYALPVGTNKCIGMYEDIIGNTVIYFNWNSDGFHGIYRYFYNNTSNIIQPLIVNNALNFKEWDYINHVNLVNNELTWNDGANPQRQIDIVRANNTGKRYKFKICFGVPNNTAQSVQYTFNNGSATSITVNFPNTINTRFQAAEFAYTTFSGSPAITALFTIEKAGDYLVFTSIAVSAWIVTVNPLGTLTSWYKPINYYDDINDRMMDVVGWPAWLEPDTLLFQDATTPANFLNGNTYQFAFSINYDDGRVSTISKYSRLMFNEEILRPSLPKDYTDYSQTAIQSAANLNCIRVRYTDSGRLVSGRQIIKSIDIYVRNNNNENLRLIDTIPDYALDGDYFFYNSSQGYVVSNNLMNRQFDNIPILSKCQEVVNNKLFYGNNLFGYDNVDLAATIISGISTIKAWDTKRKQYPLVYGKYQFGVVYFDRLGRTNFAQTNSNLVVDMTPVVPAIGESNYVSWSIPSSFQPPIWATHYAWVRTRELTTQDYWPIVATNVVYKNAAGGTVTWPNVSIRTAELTVDFLIDTQEYSQYIQGDQLLLYDNASPFPTPIVSWDAATKKLVIDYNVAVNTRLLSLNAQTFIERIYTPYRQNENEVFFECYEAYNVLNPHTANRAHAAGFQGANQVPNVTDATGYFYTCWDNFLHLVDPSAGGKASSQSYYAITSRSSIEKVTQTVTGRTPTGVRGGTSEGLSGQGTRVQAGSSLPPTDSVPQTESIAKEVEVLVNQFKVSSVGRPTAVIPENKQSWTTENVCFSNVRNVGTGYNGFGTFELLNNDNISVGFGGINRLVNIDNVLLAVCDNKSFSIYVDKGILQGQDGSSSISVSGKVIGAYRELNGFHGTINPESFASNDGLVFWWDAYRGEVCQYSSQGIDVVSSKRDGQGNVIIGMSSFFSPKGRIGIKANREQYKVKGGIHKQFKEYILSFPAVSLSGSFYPAETIAYNYIRNGWQSKYSFWQEYTCGIGQDFATTKDGSFYLHSPSAARNTFNGIAYNSEIGVVVNAAPSTSKIFLSMSCEANKSPNLPLVTTPITTWNLAGQSSELLSTDFEFMNGSYWGTFLKNKLTPNFPSEEAALNNGEELQGLTMDLNFVQSGTTLLSINQATVYFIKDELTN